MLPLKVSRSRFTLQNVDLSELNGACSSTVNLATSGDSEIPDLWLYGCRLLVIKIVSSSLGTNSKHPQGQRQWERFGIGKGTTHDRLSSAFQGAFRAPST